MDNTLNQVYQLEKELIENRTQFEKFANKEIQSIQNIKIFETSLKELEKVGDAKVYQPMGKAFILRKKDAVKTDLEFLMEINRKALEEDKKNKLHFEASKNDLEKQLIEMAKSIKLN